MRSIQNPITKDLLIEFVRKRAMKPKLPPPAVENKTGKRPSAGDVSNGNVSNGHHTQEEQSTMPPPSACPPPHKKQKIDEEQF